MQVPHYFVCGNGKRHRIPLLEGLRLKKLLCIGNKRYNLLNRYVKQTKRANLSHLPVRTSMQAGKQVDLKYNNKRNVAGCYEPTNIWNTRESKFWQWHRVYEWFMEFKDLYYVT